MLPANTLRDGDHKWGDGLRSDSTLDGSGPPSLREVVVLRLEEQEPREEWALKTRSNCFILRSIQ